jgi:hypothetical protein
MKQQAVVMLEGIELDCIAQVEMGIFWWGVHLSRIARKEVGHMGEVERWDLSFSIYPQL